MAPLRAFSGRAGRLSPEDWALLAILTAAGLLLLFAEGFWNSLPP